jgi:uncharacterized membrane protein YjfL (UPF0719 family)
MRGRLDQLRDRALEAELSKLAVLSAFEQLRVKRRTAQIRNYSRVAALLLTTVAVAAAILLAASLWKSGRDQVGNYRYP